MESDTPTLVLLRHSLGELSSHSSNILLLDFSFEELIGELARGFRSQSHDHETGGEAIQAVDS